MQHKNLKYILLIVVATIWGSIIFRILNGMNIDSSPSIVPAKSISKFKDTNSYETYDLLANYEDPFGADSDTLYEESSEDSLIKLTANFLKNSSPLDNLNKPDISFIKYKGLIINPVSHKKIAIISMNGKEESTTNLTTESNFGETI